MKLTYLIENLQTKTPHLAKTIQKQRKEYSEEQTQQLINYANMADPTGGKATYTPWIIKQELKSNIQLPEDITKISEYLTKYDQFKKLVGFEGRKDINQYQTFNDLADDVDKAAELNSKRKQIKADKASGAKKIYDNGDVKIIQILTPEASVQYAKHTKWCTSVLEKAKTYLDNEELGGLFVLLMGGEKFQFTGSLSEFMDAKNDPVEFNIDDYVKVFDVLKDSGIVSEDVLKDNFYHHLKFWGDGIDDVRVVELIKNGYVNWTDVNNGVQLVKKFPGELEPYIVKDPKSAYEYVRSVLDDKRWFEAEPAIMKDPYRAYMYARYTIKGRWPEAEPTIMKDPQNAYEYAKDVIKGRWLEAEPYIMKDPYCTYMYAMHVIKGRLPEAELIIMKDSKYAYYYTLDVMKGERWFEAEPNIMKDPLFAYYYARDVIKGRWLEAEPYIMKNPEIAYQYAEHIMGGKRWFEAEPYIMKDFRIICIYAKNIMKGERWPEAEPIIMKDPRYAYEYARLIVKKRWFEAEPYIMKDPAAAYNYTKLFIRDRWPEAEPYIMKDQYYAYEYLDLINDYCGYDKMMKIRREYIY